MGHKLKTPHLHWRCLSPIAQRCLEHVHNLVLDLGNLHVDGTCPVSSCCMLLMLNGQQQSISSAVLSSGGGVDAIVTWAADNGLYASECETSMIAVVASMIVFRTIWPTDF